MGIGAIHHPTLRSRWLLVGCLECNTTHPPKIPVTRFEHYKDSTTHPSKGLELPVVVLGNSLKDAKLQRMEEIVRPLLDREGEPLERMAEFDVMIVPICYVD